MKQRRQETEGRREETKKRQKRDREEIQANRKARGNIKK